MIVDFGFQSDKGSNQLTSELISITQLVYCAKYIDKTIRKNFIYNCLNIDRVRYQIYSVTVKNIKVMYRCGLIHFIIDCQLK